MAAYQKERIENAICFFAYEHHKRTDKHPYQTYIYKYLSFFEFNVLEGTGESPLSLDFTAMEHGPVPPDIYYEREEIKSNLFSFDKQNDGKFIVKALKKPDLDYFSDYEIAEMAKLIDIYAKKWVTSKMMSDSSHKKIKAWDKAWKRKPNSMINKSDTFDNLFSKDENQLSSQEEHFLISASLEKSVSN